MTIVEKDCVVGIEYEVKEAGTTEIVDSNKGTGQPLEFIMGVGQIIPGLEEALAGMSKDENADIMVQAEKAYGTRDDNAMQTLPVDQFEGVELKEGLTLYGQGEEGQTVQVTVISFNETEVVVDFNHPLAGKDLMFSVVVLSVRAATADEIASGQIGGGHDHGDGCCGSGQCDS